MELSSQENLSFFEELEKIHTYLHAHSDQVDRISVALYDPETDYLKTFSSSGGGSAPLYQYQFKLSKSKSLSQLVKDRQPRLISDMSSLNEVDRAHTNTLRSALFLTSYTVPMTYQGVFYGLVFFNSFKQDAFSEKEINDLNLVSYLITLIVAQDVQTQSVLKATLKSALETAGKRDFETGQHLSRVAHYSRLIAQTLAPLVGWDDEDVEHIFQFAPLHDIGKIAVPDSVLLKKGPLTEEEFEQMKHHVVEGGNLVDSLINNHGLQSIRGVDKLINIVSFHHERLDGSGYMKGLSNEAIPLEARIVAVADIFDALTSERPYKKAWSNEQAFQELFRLSDIELDQKCVDALFEKRAEVEEVQTLFSEDPIG